MRGDWLSLRVAWRAAGVAAPSSSAGHGKPQRADSSYGRIGCALRSVSLSITLVLASTVSAQETVPIGLEFTINTYTTLDQRRAAVTSLDDGSFVVSWDSAGEVFARRYSSDGTPIDPEFQVNTYTTNTQRAPAVARTGNDRFVVIWGSDGDEQPGIFGQHFGDSGAIGTEFRVNTYVSLGQGDPAVAAHEDGSFVVVWQSSLQDGSQSGVFAQRYDSQGVELGTEFQVNTYTTESQIHQTVAVQRDGGFIVAWDGLFEGANRVFGQLYDSSGGRRGAEFMVNTYATGVQRNPAATHTGNGFVLIWDSSPQDGSGSGVFGQLFDGGGNRVGTEFLVNTSTGGEQFGPTAAPDSNDGFVIVWTGPDNSGLGIFGQRFDGTANRFGTEFAVNSYETGQQFFPSVTIGPGGNFLMVWEGAAPDQDGSGSGIFGRRFIGSPPPSLPPTPTPTPPPPTFTVTQSPTFSATITPTRTPGSNGTGCSNTQHCISGFCVDGVCCDRACEAANEFCSLPGLEGTCVAVALPTATPTLTATPNLTPQRTGVPCTGDQGCLSTFCSNGVCCEERCDQEGQSCAVPGFEGQCLEILLSPTPTGTPIPSPTSSFTATRTATSTPPPSSTPMITQTRTPTPNPTFALCVGNCDGGPDVTVDELVRGVNMVLEVQPISVCPVFDPNRDGAVSIDELVRGVNNLLYGCGYVTPTPRPTSTRTRTPTATRTATRVPTATRTPAPTPSEAERLQGLIGTWLFAYQIISVFFEEYELQRVEFGVDRYVLTGVDLEDGGFVSAIIAIDSNFTFFMLDEDLFLCNAYFFDQTGPHEVIGLQFTLNMIGDECGDPLGNSNPLFGQRTSAPSFDVDELDTVGLAKQSWADGLSALNKALRALRLQKGAQALEGAK